MGGNGTKIEEVNNFDYTKIDRLRLSDRVYGRFTLRVLRIVFFL